MKHLCQAWIQVILIRTVLGYVVYQLKIFKAHFALVLISPFLVQWRKVWKTLRRAWFFSYNLGIVTKKIIQLLRSGMFFNLKSRPDKKAWSSFAKGSIWRKLHIHYKVVKKPLLKIWAPWMQNYGYNVYSKVTKTGNIGFWYNFSFDILIPLYVLLQP